MLTVVAVSVPVGAIETGAVEVEDGNVGAGVDMTELRSVGVVLAATVGSVAESVLNVATGTTSVALAVDEADRLDATDDSLAAEDEAEATPENTEAAEEDAEAAAEDDTSLTDVLANVPAELVPEVTAELSMLMVEPVETA
jgi:hypothetical protein